MDIEEPTLNSNHKIVNRLALLLIMCELVVPSTVAMHKKIRVHVKCI